VEAAVRCTLLLAREDGVRAELDGMSAGRYRCDDSLQARR